MKTFQSTAVVRYPAQQIAAVVRDRLEEIVPLLDDVDTLIVIERGRLPDGGWRQVNSWAASARVSPALAERLGRIAWTDRAVWRADGLLCEFEIETAFAPALACRGRATYSPALGGRGARVVFEGEFALPASGGGLDRLMAGAVELAAATLIPRNLKRTLDAASRLLDREGSTHQAAVVEAQPRI